MKLSGSILCASWLALVVTTTAQTATETVWVEDAVPAGARTSASNGDSWRWISAKPKPFSGKRAHQSNFHDGPHLHAFDWARQTLSVASGEVLFAYVYLDPKTPPRQVMLEWNDGTWNHRAYWGANELNLGVNGTSSRRHMGALPATGQWVRLEVPAAQVGLEGSTVRGMSFVLAGGRATWDRAGKTTAPPPPPPTDGGGQDSGGTAEMEVNVTDYVTLELPKLGDHALNVLSPTLLELVRINGKERAASTVDCWDFVDAEGNWRGPGVGEFVVKIDGQEAAVSAVGFKRRPFYAPLAVRDLRIQSSLYLQLANPIPAGETVTVTNPSGTLWPGSMPFAARPGPLRYSAAIHVNQEGYVPAFPKKAMVGYYAGSLGEMPIADTRFSILNTRTGAVVFEGTMTLRKDVGYTYSPTPYQQVWEADFSGLTAPGEYRLIVPGLGGSLPFLVDNGVPLAFARTYALGLYHQRCGQPNELPYTRHTHAACHLGAATVPVPQSEYAFTWGKIAQNNADYAKQPRHTAPQLKDEASQLYPFVNRGPIDVAGGHHDAGDYSKYTINVAALVHSLVFSVDVLPGAAALDNLGLPQSRDGISDLLQEAKIEADFLAKLQDADGGFYFLVYPRNRAYEGNVTPENGDPQVVWPKNTAATAAAVAALAQTASSPRFRQQYPQEAAMYLAKAKLGWQFLVNAIERHGKDGAYQKITHYGDVFMHDDELAWAACELFLATGETGYHEKLKEWLDPADPSTRRWGWVRLFEGYGCAITSYAFAARTGRRPAAELDATYLAKCETEVRLAAQEAAQRSRDGAYGSSFPAESKRVKGGGWYFSLSSAYDLAVGYQLDPDPAYLEAMVANLNYEAGVNPVNVSFLTGLGWKRNREVVHQYAQNDRRILPPGGLPQGNIVPGFFYNYTYGTELAALTYPRDNAATAPYPFYDRWADAYSVATEFVVVNQAHALGVAAFLASRASLGGAWKPPLGRIEISSAEPRLGQPIPMSVSVPGMGLEGARVVWEGRDQEPAYGQTFNFVPRNSGLQWVEAEIQWADGARVVATAEFVVDNGLPHVTVNATDSTATEGANDHGVLEFSRTGSTESALTVDYVLGGSASKWSDYRRVEGDMPVSITIPAGASSATMTLWAVDDADQEGTEQIVVSVAASATYNVGQPASATVSITDND